MGKNTGKTVEKKWKPWKDESNIWGSGNTKRRGACRLPAFVASEFFVHRKRFMFSSKSNEESKSFCPKRLGHLVGFERLVDSWFQVFFEELNPNRWSHDWDSAISPDIGKTLIFGYRTRYSISFDGDKICVKYGMSCTDFFGICSSCLSSSPTHPNKIQGTDKLWQAVGEKKHAIRCNFTAPLVLPKRRI